MKNILFIGLILITSTIAAQQNVEFVKDNFKDDKAGLKEAVKYMEAGDNTRLQGEYFYRFALNNYLKANDFNPNNAELNYKIGESYLYSNYKLKAIPYLEKALKLNPAIDSKIRLLLGRAYHLNLEFDKAITEYNTYLRTLSGEEEIIMVEKKIDECKYGKELVKSPIRVKIQNLGGEVNTPESEYRPLINADESVLLFTSTRATGLSGDKINPASGGYFEDVYMSVKEDGKWTAAQNIGKPINSEANDALSGFSVDGQKCIVYIGKPGDMGDLYESELNGKIWSKPDHMNKNINTNSNESSAWYSPDGRTVYFVSNRPGGYGGRDIYKSTLDDKDKWGEAVNLGPTINTEFDEKGVFLHPDGRTLYFSSEGHNTMGGFDIFKAVFDEESKEWSKPTNLGYPLNTADDDAYFVLSGSGKHGYYSSYSSNGFGEIDILMVTFLGPEKIMTLANEDNLLASNAAPVKETFIAEAIEIEEAQLTILKGIVTDAKTNDPLEATIELVDNEKNVVIATFKSNSASGKYLVSLPAGKNYGIAVKKENYLFHSENFDIPVTSAFQEIEKDVALNSIAVGSKIVLKNIFFDLSKATLRPESIAELERLKKLLQDIPTLKIEISGHTDSRGSAASNQSLSERRAKAVVDYLVKAGVAANRLTFKGYGEEQPIAANDTEENMQLNRRTEFKVMGK